MKDKIRKMLREDIEDDFSWIRQTHVVDVESIKEIINKNSRQGIYVSDRLAEAIYEAGLTDAQVTTLVEALDIIHEVSYEEGLDSGYDNGRDSGWDDGYEEGKTDGYEEGYEEGSSGKDDAYDNGYEEGHDIGYEKGCEECSGDE